MLQHFCRSLTRTGSKRGPQGFPSSSFFFSVMWETNEKVLLYMRNAGVITSPVIQYSSESSGISIVWSEYKAVRAFEWDKGYSETSCVQVITSSLYHHTCTLEQFTYPGKSQCCILALNYEIDCFDLSSRDSKQQELIKHTCEVRLTSITISFLLLTII